MCVCVCVCVCDCTSHMRIAHETQSHMKPRFGFSSCLMSEVLKAGQLRRGPSRSSSTAPPSASPAAPPAGCSCLRSRL